MAPNKIFLTEWICEQINEQIASMFLDIPDGSANSMDIVISLVILMSESLWQHHLRLLFLHGETFVKVLIVLWISNILTIKNSKYEFLEKQYVKKQISLLIS
jgi:hypothetical protein